jgi:hypothetical protein
MSQIESLDCNLKPDNTHALESLDLSDSSETIKKIKITFPKEYVYTEYVLDEKEAQMSEFFKVLLSETIPDSDGYIRCELETISNDTFKYIYTYMKHYNGKPQEIVHKPLRSSNFEECVNDIWDYNFVKNFKIVDLIFISNACNYLNIQCLMHLCLSFVACKIRGKTEDEVREIFKMPENM